MLPDCEKSPAAGGGFEQDEALLRHCMLGDERAWSMLARKYAGLIFSIPIRRGLGEEDASDVFQSVCVALLGSMSTIREPRALAAWLIRTTVHTCDKLMIQRQRWTGIEPEYENTASGKPTPDKLVDQLEREQLVREVLAAQSPECQKLIHLLFFSDPPIAYQSAAAKLGLAKGSIGATRMRCLEKLRRSLEEKRFR
jgi:RNA polymerase sigma factor (sigma-70 family)